MAASVRVAFASDSRNVPAHICPSMPALPGERRFPLRRQIDDVLSMSMGGWSGVHRHARQPLEVRRAGADVPQRRHGGGRVPLSLLVGAGSGAGGQLPEYQRRRAGGGGGWTWSSTSRTPWPGMAGVNSVLYAAYERMGAIADRLYTSRSMWGGVGAGAAVRGQAAVGREPALGQPSAAAAVHAIRRLDRAGGRAVHVVGDGLRAQRGHGRQRALAWWRQTPVGRMR